MKSLIVIFVLEVFSILGVSSSSLLMVGDTNSIQLTSLFDTPPESLIIGPFVPLTPHRIMRCLNGYQKSIHFKLVSAALASTIQIGDSNEINGLTRAHCRPKAKGTFLFI